MQTRLPAGRGRGRAPDAVPRSVTAPSRRARPATSNLGAKAEFDVFPSSASRRKRWEQRLLGQRGCRAPLGRRRGLRRSPRRDQRNDAGASTSWETAADVYLRAGDVARGGAWTATTASSSTSTTQRRIRGSVRRSEMAEPLARGAEGSRSLGLADLVKIPTTPVGAPRSASASPSGRAGRLPLRRTPPEPGARTARRLSRRSFVLGVLRSGTFRLLVHRLPRRSARTAPSTGSSAGSGSFLGPRPRQHENLLSPSLIPDLWARR